MDMNDHNIVVADEAGIYIGAISEVGDAIGACFGASGPRFSELVLEHKSSNALRFFRSRSEAEAWLSMQ
jgi:hypothetical protein